MELLLVLSKKKNNWKDEIYNMGNKKITGINAAMSRAILRRTNTAQDNF